MNICIKIMIIMDSMNNYCTQHNLEMQSMGWSWDYGWLPCVCLWIHLPVYLRCNAMQCNAMLAVLFVVLSLLYWCRIPPCSCSLLPHLCVRVHHYYLTSSMCVRNSHPLHVRNAEHFVTGPVPSELHACWRCVCIYHQLPWILHGAGWQQSRSWMP